MYQCFCRTKREFRASELSYLSDSNLRHSDEEDVWLFGPGEEYDKWVKEDTRHMDADDIHKDERDGDSVYSIRGSTPTPLPSVDGLRKPLTPFGLGFSRVSG